MKITPDIISHFYRINYKTFEEEKVSRILLSNSIESYVVLRFVSQNEAHYFAEFVQYLNSKDIIEQEILKNTQGNLISKINNDNFLVVSRVPKFEYLAQKNINKETLTKLLFLMCNIEEESRIFLQENSKKSSPIFIPSAFEMLTDQLQEISEFITGEEIAEVFKKKFEVRLDTVFIDFLQAQLLQFRERFEPREDLKTVTIRFTTEDLIYLPETNDVSFIIDDLIGTGIPVIEYASLLQTLKQMDVELEDDDVEDVVMKQHNRCLSSRELEIRYLSFIVDFFELMQITTLLPSPDKYVREIRRSIKELRKSNIVNWT